MTSETWTDCTGTDYQLIYKWNNANADAGDSAKASNSWKASNADQKKSVTCSVTVKTADGTQIGNVISETVDITVKAETPLIYVGGLELTAKVDNNNVGSEGVKEGDVVTFEVTGTPKVKLGKDGTAVNGTASTYTWTGLTAAATSSTATWTADASSSKTVSCKVVVTYGGKTVEVNLPSKTIKVTSNQSEANKAFDAAVKAAKAFTYNSRPTTLTGSTISYIEYAGDSTTGADAIGFSGTIDGYTNIRVVKVDATHVKVTAKPSSGDPKSVESTQFALNSTTPSVNFTTNLTSGKVNKATVAVGGEISVSAVLTDVEARSYEWLIDGVTVGTQTADHRAVLPQRQAEQR